MYTTDNPTALESVVSALLSGKPISLTLAVNPTPDGNGVAFTGQVTTTQQSQPVTPPVIVPPIILPPVAPPTVPPVTPPQAVPPVVPVSPPPQFATTTHPVPIPPTLKTTFPYPTNAWWENIILGKNRIAPEPYQIQVVDNGFLCCYPVQVFAQDSQGMQHITTQFLQNFTLEFAEKMGSWAVTKYDDLTVTLKWTAANGQSATSVIAQGCPYLSMAYTGTTPLLTTQHAITSINGFTNQGSYTGSKFKIVLNNKQTWIVYCSSPLVFTVSGNQLLAGAPFTGVIRLACLVNASDEAILDQYVTAIPTGGTVSAQYGATNMAYTFNWNVAGSGSLLMCALPHHMDIIQAPTTVTTSWRSMKGETTGVVGNSWTLVEQMPQIQWRAPRPINPAYKDAIAAQLKKDANFVASSTSDTYFAGKSLAKAALLVLIAEELGDTDSATRLRNNLKASLTTWLSESLFTYDTTWGGMQFAPAGRDTGADFGFNYYNDAPYHAGYIVYACSVLAKGDPGWMAAYKDKVTMLLHHYANPDLNDSRFIPRRCKDMYVGHSWVAGLFDFADSRDEESTSEAIAGYFGAMLWGVATGDTAAQNYGALLMAMEIRSARKYWHVYNGNNVYGSQWTSNGVGIQWGTKQDDSTWFDNHLSCRRGIQVIPVNNATELYVEPAWVQAMALSGELAKMQAENFGTWPTFVNAMLAVIDKATAWNNVNAMSDAQIDDGASRTSLMYFVATRP